MPNWVQNILEVRGEADTLRQFTVPSDNHAVSKEPGMHNVIIDHQRQLFVDQYSSATLPFRVNVCSLADGSVVRSLFVNKVSRQS